MKTLILFLCALLAFSAVASAQTSTPETVNDINEAVTKAQLQLAKELGLVPADNAAATPSTPELTDADAGAAKAEEAQTIDIMAAEQMFWSEVHGEQAGEDGGDEGESAGQDDGGSDQ